MSASRSSSDQLSLVPYDSENREVLFRHGNAVVVFDTRSSELSLRSSIDETYELGDCPYCHRPLPDDNDNDTFGQHHNAFRRRPTRSDASFVRPDYFRMLALSIPDTEPENSSNRTQLPSPLTELPPPTGTTFVDSTPDPTPPGSSGIRGSSFLPGYFAKFFVEKKLLGRGGRGVVHLVEHVLDTVSLGDFACKKIPVGNDHDWLAKVLIEVQLLQQLDHANLVSYRHVWLEDAQLNTFGPTVPCVFILQQFCNAGDLHTYVQQLNGDQNIDGNDIKRQRRTRKRLRSYLTLSRQHMPLDEIFSFFKDITSGLHHLHVHGYIHRDLKPSNCLLHRDNHRVTVLVSDFGEVQAAGSVRDSTGATGTISYCAPEVLRRDNRTGAFGNFTTSSDIFSLGMIVFYMCFGRLPYSNASHDNEEECEDIEILRQEILDWGGFDDMDKIRDDLPERLYRSLNTLLSLDPVDRPSTESILGVLRSTSAGFTDREPVPATSLPAQVRPPTPVRRASLKQSTAKISPSSPALHQKQKDTKSRDVVLSKRILPLAARAAEKEQQLLLPAPPRRVKTPDTTRVDTQGARRYANEIGMVRLVNFGLKIASLTYPCSPYAVKSWVLISLLLLAAVDLHLAASKDRTQSKIGFLVGWTLSFVLLIAHLVILAGAQRFGLCQGDSASEYSSLLT